MNEDELLSLLKPEYRSEFKSDTLTSCVRLINPHIIVNYYPFQGMYYSIDRVYRETLSGTSLVDVIHPYLREDT